MRNALALSLALLAAAAVAEVPHLKKTGNATQLIVDGKPFIMIAGEAHNSSASAIDYMDRVLAKFAQLNANTFLAPIAWEQFEPAEGKYDYTLIDGMVRLARKHNQKVVVLWFGSWKNGVSSYAPEWVKRDGQRFPEARNKAGSFKTLLSTLSETNRDVDARAFAALMRRIKKIDAGKNTVIMVQVQNEIGIRPELRDHAKDADAAFASAVPKPLMDYLSAHKDGLHPELLKRWGASGFKAEGTWDEVFGGTPGAEEAFSVWHYARYVEAVTVAGKKEYPLPMYVNAWLPAPDAPMGNYPCGGPVAHMLDVWRAAAPSIDLFAPDIYLGTFKEICAEYTRDGNPLMIPEHARDDDVAAKAYWAFGRHQGLCFAPFGFESFTTNHPIVAAYGILNQLMPLIGAAQGTGRLTAVFCQNNEQPTQERISIGGWTLLARAEAGKKEHNGRGGAIIIQTGDDEFIAAGHDFTLNAEGNTRFLSVEMGRIENGAFKPELRLNGDESGANWQVRHPAFSSNHFLGPARPRIFRFRLFRYEG
ncbi:MAG: DUF5597 domain-containing protein [Kiritimatiellaeota bacterium]|nr:DUF5597 domain-containing protein [Kiritimatiellota bacterium]